ncbi:hypothetical protein LshimejAT787_0600050 [Lyophyllum shimeji]|uniref:Uncharacterized protein n=1 Tax=Lyophyllum shimeji TaxID=47721 RepID=A0A9P3UMN8_LYOSH|nr:hypothetical protein LshimejAT787_0600050 [Lyophyllum shimeji]
MERISVDRADTGSHPVVTTIARVGLGARPLAVSIDDLPAELLQLSFKFLYMKSRRRNPILDVLYDDTEPYETMWLPDDDLRSLAAFPTAPASLSRKRSVILTVLSAALTAGILRQRSAEYLTIVRCPLTEVTSLPCARAVPSRYGRSTSGT